MKNNLSFAALIVITVLLCASHVKAQPKYAVDQGVLTLNGSLGFSSQIFSQTGFTNSTLTTISLSPQISYFVISNLAIGGTVNFVSQSQSGSSLTQVGVGPTIAYYFGDQSVTVYPFVQGSFFYNSLSSGSGNSSSTASGVGFEADAGITSMLAKNIGLTLAAFFQYSSYSQNNARFNISTFGVKVGITGFLF